MRFLLGVVKALYIDRGSLAGAGAGEKRVHAVFHHCDSFVIHFAIVAGKHQWRMSPITRHGDQPSGTGMVRARDVSGCHF